MSCKRVLIRSEAINVSKAACTTSSIDYSQDPSGDFDEPIKWTPEMTVLPRVQNDARDQVEFLATLGLFDHVHEDCDVLASDTSHVGAVRRHIRIPKRVCRDWRWDLAIGEVLVEGLVIKSASGLDLTMQRGGRRRCV